MEKFNQAKNFKVMKNFILACEFFKPLGHLNNIDLKVFVQHLLGRIPNWNWLYPKVTVHKTSKVHCSHYSIVEWIGWRKIKVIVFQELNNIGYSLEVVMAKEIVDNEKWRAWKRSHNVSSAAWNVLLTIFCKVTHKWREAEEGVGVPREVSCGTACAFEFLEAEEEFKVAGSLGKFRTINSETMMLGRNWTYQKGRRLSLAIIDLRETPRAQYSAKSCEISIFSPSHVSSVDIEASFYVNACDIYKLAK